ncbi:MAG: CDP-alcohol phosphatidyltransferase family protein [Kiritimatiellae bacterium]|nr:CDP-alcohol phosphatidyltransferase family protein [Kiritimatiellia bacterium]
MSRSLAVNAITFARVPLVFAWLVLAVAHEFDGGFPLAFWACAAMLFSGLTDAYDGYLARRWKVVSQLGKMADPLMDKVFYIVAFPALVWMIAHQGESGFHAVAMLAFSILYMLRDTWVTFLRSVGAIYGADVGAMRLGKIRTALSFPGAGWVYFYLAFHRDFPASWNGPWLWTCYAVEAFLAGITLLSFATYTRAYAPYLLRALDRRGQI